MVDMNNDRMQLLALLARLLMLEFANGPVDLKDHRVEEFIESHPVPDGNIFDESFESREEVKRVLRLLNTFYDIFKNDRMISEDNGVKELSREYVIISLYLLLRHLVDYYVITKDQHFIFKNFVTKFHRRLRERNLEDLDISIFRVDNRARRTWKREI